MASLQFAIFFPLGAHLLRTRLTVYHQGRTVKRVSPRRRRNLQKWSAAAAAGITVFIPTIGTGDSNPACPAFFSRPRRGNVDAGLASMTAKISRRARHAIATTWRRNASLRTRRDRHSTTPPLPIGRIIAATSPEFRPEPHDRTS